MNFEIIPTPDFVKDIKPLIKKYPSLRQELLQLQHNLLNNPTLGEPLGKDCYKIRLSIASKGKGKSGGARVITCVKIINEIIFMVAIYDKSEMENIDDNVLKERLNKIR